MKITGIKNSQNYQDILVETLVASGMLCLTRPFDKKVIKKTLQNKKPTDLKSVESLWPEMKRELSVSARLPINLKHQEGYCRE